MNLGKCAFKGCKSPAGTCIEKDETPLLVCRTHYWRLSELHTEDIIKKTFAIKGGEYV